MPVSAIALTTLELIGTSLMVTGLKVTSHRLAAFTEQIWEVSSSCSARISMVPDTKASYPVTEEQLQLDHVQNDICHRGNTTFLILS